MERLVFRKIAQHGDLMPVLFQFLLQHIFEPWIKHLRHTVEDEPADAAVPAKFRHPFYERSQGKGGSPAGHYKYDRSLKRPRHIVGTPGIRIQSPAVIIPHNALRHHEIGAGGVTEESFGQL